MKRDTDNDYPSFRTYVIRVQSDARPYALTGRLEGLSTEKHWDFSSGHDLLTAIARDIDARVKSSPANGVADSSGHRVLRVAADSFLDEFLSAAVEERSSNRCCYAAISR